MSPLRTGKRPLDYLLQSGSWLLQMTLANWTSRGVSRPKNPCVRGISPSASWGFFMGYLSPAGISGGPRPVGLSATCYRSPPGRARQLCRHCLVEGFDDREDEDRPRGARSTTSAPWRAGFQTCEALMSPSGTKRGFSPPLKACRALAAGRWIKSIERHERLRDGPGRAGNL